LQFVLFSLFVLFSSPSPPLSWRFPLFISFPYFPFLFSYFIFTFRFSPTSYHFSYIHFTITEKSPQGCREAGCIGKVAKLGKARSLLAALIYTEMISHEIMNIGRKTFFRVTSAIYKRRCTRYCTYTWNSDVNMIYSRQASASPPVEGAGDVQPHHASFWTTDGNPPYS
jgi:hypothetical protein